MVPVYVFSGLLPSLTTAPEGWKIRVSENLHPLSNRALIHCNKLHRRMLMGPINLFQPLMQAFAFSRSLSSSRTVPVWSVQRSGPGSIFMILSSKETKERIIISERPSSAS